MKNRKLTGAIGIIISLLAVYYLYVTIDFQTSFDTLSNTPWYFFALLIVIYLFTFVLRTFRWNLMLPQYQQVSQLIFLKSIILGFAGNNLLPARAGELVRMKYLNQNSQVSNITALSSIFIEKILDGLILVFILILCLSTMNLATIEYSWINKLKFTVSFIFLLAIFILVVIKYFQSNILIISQRFFGESSRLINSIVVKINEALGFFKPDLNSLVILLLGGLIWIIEGSLFVLALWMLSVNVNFLIAGFLCLCIVNFGILIPSSPGYIGVFQSMFILALSLFNTSPELAFSASVLVHFCQFFPITLIGILIFFSESFKIFK